MENLAHRNREEDTHILSVEAIARMELERPDCPPRIRLKLQQIIGETRHAFPNAA